MANTIIITGNLTADPEISETSNGNTMVKFRIADDGYGRDVMWWSCTAFDESPVRVLKKAKKGSSVNVVAELKGLKDEDGKTRQPTGKALGVDFLGGKKREQQDSSGGGRDELPF